MRRGHIGNEDFYTAEGKSENGVCTINKETREGERDRGTGIVLVERGGVGKGKKRQGQDESER